MDRPLSDLEGEIVSIEGRPNKLDCLFFWCPACETPHGILVSFLPPSLYPSGAVWTRSGRSIDDLTVSPSIDCTISGSCRFHGWVRGGRVSW